MAQNDAIMAALAGSGAYLGTSALMSPVGLQAMMKMGALEKQLMPAAVAGGASYLAFGQLAMARQYGPYITGIAIGVVGYYAFSMVMENADKTGAGKDGKK